MNLRAHIANFVGSGARDERLGCGQVRSYISTELEGYRIRIEQASDVEKYRKEKNISTVNATEIVVYDVAEIDVKNVLSVVDRLCWILSFVSISGVARNGYEYPDRNPREFRSITSKLNCFRPTLDITNGQNIERFIGETYNNYKKFEHSRKLNVVFDYLIQLQNHSLPLEIQLLVGFVMLENLKYSFAMSEGIHHDGRGFIQSYGKKNRPIYFGFEKLLLQMFQKVGMRRGLKQIVNLRNEIVHSGITSKSIGWQSMIDRRTNDLTREYLLRLLGYSGNYPVYSKSNSKYNKI